mmetsp:Transcript_859/g.1678  ORF Transcript_859/g.1678 Transcript_859/m.1678 type:complete len:380 (+) Transcript_859:9-1148(+)
MKRRRVSEKDKCGTLSFRAAFAGVLILTVVILLLNGYRLDAPSTMQTSKIRPLLVAGDVTTPQLEVEAGASQSASPLASASATSSAKKEPLQSKSSEVFAPGTLALPRQDVLAQCWSDPQNEFFKQHYARHTCTYSDKYKLLYYLIEKSGSSSNRLMTAESLGASETSCTSHQSQSKAQIAFVRNPITRFFAQYEEFTARRLDRKNTEIPQQYRSYLDGLPSYKAYDALFTQPQKLTERFERFLQLWDGREVFDVHLRKQTMYLSDDKTGYGLQLDYIGEVNRTMMSDWKRMSSLFGLPEVKEIHGRTYPRRMNTSSVNVEALRALCRITAVDFCCLNFLLPPACQGVVECKWVTPPRPHPRKLRKVIETVVHPEGTQT